MRARKLKIVALLLAASLVSGCGAVRQPESTPEAIVSPAPTAISADVEVQSGTLHETVASEGAAGIRAVGEYSYDRETGLRFTLELANPWAWDTYFSLGLCLNGYTDYPGELYISAQGREPGEPVGSTAAFTVMQPPGVSRYDVLFVPTGDSLVRAAADIERLEQVALTYMFYYHPDAHTREFAQGIHTLPIGSGSAEARPSGEPLYSEGGDGVYCAGYEPRSRCLLLEISGGGLRYRLRPTLEGFSCLRFSPAPGSPADEDEIYADAGEIPEGMLSLRVICIEEALEELGADQPTRMSLRIRAVSPGQGASPVDTEADIPLDVSPENPLPPLESLPVVMENQLFRLRLIHREGGGLCLALENLTKLDMWFGFETGEATWGDGAYYLLGESPCAVPAGGRCTLRVTAYSELTPYTDGSPGATLGGETPLEGAMTLSCKLHYSPGHEAKPNEIYEQTLSLPE